MHCFNTFISQGPCPPGQIAVAEANSGKRCSPNELHKWDLFFNLLFFKGSLKCECRAEMRSHYWPATGNTFRKISIFLPFNFLRYFSGCTLITYYTRWLHIWTLYIYCRVFDLKRVLLLIHYQAKFVYRKVLPPLRKRTLQAGRTVQVKR